MCFIERETQTFILKFKEIFQWRETGLMAHGMKFEETPRSCQIYAFFGEKKRYML